MMTILMVVVTAIDDGENGCGYVDVDGGGICNGGDEVLGVTQQ